MLLQERLHTFPLPKRSASNRGHPELQGSPGDLGKLGCCSARNAPPLGAPVSTPLPPNVSVDIFWQRRCTEYDVLCIQL